MILKKPKYVYIEKANFHCCISEEPPTLDDIRYQCVLKIAGNGNITRILSEQCGVFAAKIYPGKLENNLHIDPIPF